MGLATKSISIPIEDVGIKAGWMIDEDVLVVLGHSYVKTLVGGPEKWLEEDNVMKERAEQWFKTPLCDMKEEIPKGGSQ